MKYVMTVLGALLVIGLTWWFLTDNEDPTQNVPISSVSEIKQRALLRIERMEEDIKKGKVTLDGVRNLAVSLNFLMGHMKSTNEVTQEQRYTKEQLYQLKGTLFQIARSQGRGGEVLPPDWRDDGGAIPPTYVDSGPIKQMLPHIRELVEGIPDSDIRPDISNVKKAQRENRKKDRKDN